MLNKQTTPLVAPMCTVCMYTVQYSTVQDRTGQDSTVQDSTGQDMTVQEYRTGGQDSTFLYCMHLFGCDIDIR